MPRLLSLNSYHYRRGGSDVVYLDHEEMFRGMGWDTAHMSMRHPKNIDSPWEDYFVDEIEFGQSYGFLEKFEMAAKVVYSFEARKKLNRLLDKFPANVAHVHCIYHHLSPSVLPLLKERGVPVVLTAHDLKIACPAYKMLNGNGICERCRNGNLANVVLNRCVRGSIAVSALVAIESSVSRMFGLYKKNVSRVIAPSRFYERKLIEWGWSPEQISYVPNYVNANRHVPNFAPGSYFLYFGRLAPEKGVATLIDAAKSSKIQLKIVGGGPLEAELRQRANGAAVEFLGFRGGDELWGLVKGARAIVLPSEWYENSPMSILEAYALGKPVIGADIGGIPEMIIPERTGWVFGSGRVEELSAVLNMVSSICDSKLEAMGREARAFVASEFNADRYLEGILGVYREIGVEVY